MFGSVTLRGGTTEWRFGIRPPRLENPSIDGMPSLRSVVARAAGMLASWKAGEPERDSSAGDNARGSPCAASTGSDIKVADHSYATLYVQWLWLVCWMFKLRHSLTASRISPPLALLSTIRFMAYAERFALCFASVTLRGWKDGNVALVIQNCGASSGGNARNTNCKKRTCRTRGPVTSPGSDRAQTALTYRAIMQHCNSAGR